MKVIIIISLLIANLVLFMRGARYALSNDHSIQLQTLFLSDLRSLETCRAGAETYVLTSTDTEWYLQSGSPAGASPDWSYSEIYYPSASGYLRGSGKLQPQLSPGCFCLRKPALMDVSCDFFVQTRSVPGCLNPNSLSYGGFARIDWTNSESDWYPNLNGILMLYSSDNSTKVMFYSLYYALSGNVSIPIIYTYNSTGRTPRRNRRRDFRY